MALPPKQERFVHEYLIDLNATNAARLAGYKHPNIQGPRLLVNVSIQERIKELKSKCLARVDVKAENVLLELGRLAFSDARRLFRSDGSLKTMEEMDDNTAAAIASVEVFEEFRGTGENRTLVGYTKKIRLWDKNKALENLAKHFKLLTDVVEQTGAVVHLHVIEKLEEKKPMMIEVIDGNGRENGKPLPNAEGVS